MAGKNTAVFAMFDETGAELAVDALRSAGFRKEDISCLCPDNKGSKDFAHRKGTKAPEGATVGVATGGDLGGALGWLTGMGALAIPGIGPVIAAGPLVAALAGTGAGGALGGVSGALIGMGIPEYEAKRFEGLIKEGKILLSVHCDRSEWVSKAKEILRECRGEHISSSSEAKANVEASTSEKPYPRKELTDDNDSPTAGARYRDGLKQGNEDASTQV